MMHFRRKIETTIGQLAQYFDIENINCLDLWHLTSLIYRNLLSYTIAMKVNIINSRQPIVFDGLIS